jgi:diketogulonate reductase-like aldo/keto reductase
MMVKASDIPMIKLNNGVKMPQMGLGVWEAESGDEVENAITTALTSGYRMIDTAKAYGNEASVGKAVQKAISGGIMREDIFVTTKLWNADHKKGEAMRAFDESLEQLGLEYVDLYLIHWPLPMHGKFQEVWRDLEKMYADKRVRAIGVSNFKPAHLEELLHTANTVPAVNQIELHPHFQQRETREFCKKYGIEVEAYSPLKRGGNVLDEPTITSLAEAHGKTPAQVVLRWHVQEGLIVIPKSVTPERIAGNVNIFDFVLDDDEMEQMRALDRNDRHLPDPDTFNPS